MVTMVTLIVMASGRHGNNQSQWQHYYYNDNALSLILVTYYRHGNTLIVMATHTWGSV